jgi:hypothetical protein
MRIRNGAALALLACGIGCTDSANGDDPLAALDSMAVTTRYTQPYWVQEMRGQTPTWDQALAICGEATATQRPNCAFVREVKAIAPRQRQESEGVNLFDHLPEPKE